MFYKISTPITEMLLTNHMNSEERLNHMKALFEDSVSKMEEKRAVEKLNKRKRQNSGTSITSTISSVSSNVATISPPNKKMRGPMDSINSEASSGIPHQHLENSNFKTETYELNVPNL